MIGKIIAFPFLLLITISTGILFILSEIVMAPLLLFYTIIRALWCGDSILENIIDTIAFLLYPFTDIIPDLWGK